MLCCKSAIFLSLLILLHDLDQALDAGLELGLAVIAVVGLIAVERGEGHAGHLGQLALDLHHLAVHDLAAAVDVVNGAFAVHALQGLHAAAHHGGGIVTVGGGEAVGPGIAVGKNQILLFGGDEGETFNKTETLIMAIANEKDEVKKNALIEQKNKLQMAHPGFKPEVLLYNTVTNNWSQLANIPFPSAATTTAVLWGKCIFIPSGEIKAGVRTAQILLGTIK